MEISIPYGAIKSEDFVIKFIQNYLFQFLMVRLKEGAILRSIINVYKFQFLMVRLKGASGGI